MSRTYPTPDPERVAFLRAINAAPRERTPQLAFADWLADRGDPWEKFWRNGGVRVGLVGRGGLGVRGGLVGRGGLGVRVGLGGLGGLGGLVGRGGLGGLLTPEAPIVLIPGEQVLVFIPNGYGFSVLVGKVAVEMPHGWIVDPCREVLDTRNGDCWAELAKGKQKKLRSDAQYGPPIEGGVRVPLGCLSMVWFGELPE